MRSPAPQLSDIAREAAARRMFERHPCTLIMAMTWGRMSEVTREAYRRTVDVAFAHAGEPIEALAEAIVQLDRRLCSDPRNRAGRPKEKATWLEALAAAEDARWAIGLGGSHL